MADTFTTILGAMWFHIPPQCTETPLNFHTWNDRFTDVPCCRAAGYWYWEQNWTHMTNWGAIVWRHKLNTLMTLILTNWWVCQTEHQYISSPIQSNHPMIILWSLEENCTDLVQANCVTLLRQCDQARQVCLLDRKRNWSTKVYVTQLPNGKPQITKTYDTKKSTMWKTNRSLLSICVWQWWVLVIRTTLSIPHKNIWLEQQYGRTGLQASKGLIPGLPWLVWRDWNEGTTSCAQLHQLVIAAKFLSGGENQLYWYVITFSTLCVSLDLPQTQ
jgi:hypothetical protein